LWSQILETLIECPPDRLAVVVSFAFIIMQAIAIRCLWKDRNRRQREIDSIHDLQTKITAQLVRILLGEPGA
jgi:hypothetical protein